MGGKGGGGSVDTSGIEAATQEATELQKMMYDQTREDTIPWYDVGKSGLGVLADYMGLSGGSVKSREQIYGDLLPQYTTQNGISNGLYEDESGNVLTQQGVVDSSYNRAGTAGVIKMARGRRTQNALRGALGDDAEFSKVAQQYGYNPIMTQSDSIDYDALNTAVEEQLTAQSQTPEGFGSLLERFDLDKFEEDPGYQFRQEEANKALERGLSAQGVTLGGGGVGEVNPQVARAMQELNQNLASQEYGNAYNRYNADQGNIFNRLMGVSGMGQGTSAQLANAGQQYATNTSNLNTGLAQAQLQAQTAANAQPSMFDTLLNAGTQLGSAYLLAGSDRRIKENIKELPKENNHKMYEFSYKGNPKKYIGVMAQDILKTNPEAVVDINGVLHVDYGRLGVAMREVS